MSAYRNAPESEPALFYDYAKALDRKRSRVISNSIRSTLCLASSIGVYPFAKLFGPVGWLIGIASFAFVAVPLAIRWSQQTTENEIEAYEERLLAKARKPSRKKRR